MVNPSITGTAIIKALDRENELAANATQARQSQAALDEAELHDLEQAQYYGPTRPQKQAMTPGGQDLMVLVAAEKDS